jgi:hypothetical protein
MDYGERTTSIMKLVRYADANTPYECDQLWVEGDRFLGMGWWCSLNRPLAKL